MLKELAPETSNFIAPRNEIEKRCCEIWQELLQCDKVGIEDDFFSLGGTSILAIKFAMLIETEFGLRLHVKQVFDTPTISQIAELLTLKRNQDSPAIGNRAKRIFPPGRCLPISRFQRKFWSKWKIWPEGVDDNYCFAFDIQGKLDVDLLARAFRHTVNSHEAMRSVYCENEKHEACFFPDTGVIPEVHIVSISKSDNRSCEKAIRDFVKEFALRPHKLDERPPVRLGIMRISDERHIAVFAIHHIMVDGASTTQIEHWALSYNSFLRDGVFPTLTVDSLTQYVNIEPNLYPREKELESSDFLMRLTDGVPAYLPLPYYKTGKRAIREGIYFEIDKDVFALAKKYARSNQSTMFWYYSAIFSALVMHYADNKSCLLSYRHNCRPAGFKDLISVFVDSLPLRAQLDEKTTFTDLILSITDQRQESKKYNSCLFEDFVQRLQAQRGHEDNKTPFNVAINQTVLTDSTPLNLNGLKCASLAPPETEMNIDLLLEIDIQNGNRFRFGYNGAKFTKQFAEQAVMHFNTLFESAVQNPDVPLIKLLEIVRADKQQGTQSQPATIESHSGELVSPTHMQSRIWFLHKMEGDNACAYNSPLFWELDGKINLEALEYAINKLTERQESLRTVFPQKHGTLSLVVLPPQQIKLTPEEITESDLENFMSQEARRAFDLETGPLFIPRLMHITGDNERYFLSLNFHHIIIDAWSLNIVADDFKEFYTAKIENRTSQLPDLPLQLRDYAIRQNEFLHSETMKKRTGDYARYLEGACTELNVLPDKPPPDKQSFAGSAGAFFIDDSLRDMVENFSRSAGVTPFNVYLTAFGALLRYYTGEDDLLVGVPSLGRDEESLQYMTGFFVNTMAVRIDMSGNPVFSEMAKNVRVSVGEALEYQDVPIDQLVSKLHINRRADRFPLIQVMFSMQDSLKDKIELPDLDLNLVFPPRTVSLFDFTLELIPMDRGLLGLLEYSTDLFNSETARHIISHYINLLKEAVQNPGSRLSELPVMTSDEHQFVLGEEMQGPEIVDHKRRVYETISLRANENPQKIAVVLNDMALTREELEIRSNNLSKYLCERGLKKGDHLGIALKSTLEFLPSLLAAMKSGAVIVPLDIQSPLGRCQQILATANLKFLIVEDEKKDFTEVFKNSNVVVIDLSAEAENISRLSPAPMATSLAPEDPLYIIYTSGTTGKPKGVLVSHGAFEKHCQACVDTFCLTDKDRVLKFAPIFFDAGFEQVFPALTAGATVVIRSETPWTPVEFYSNTAKYELTVVDLPPLYIRELLHYWSRHPEYAPQGLRMVLSGGEALPVDVAKQWLSSPVGEVPLLNVYGPTEGVITSTYFRVHSNAVYACATPTVPIGRPMPGRLLRILDPMGNPVSPGVAGELCIGGECLAEGYYNEPELTSKSFCYWIEKNGRGIWLDKQEDNAIKLYRTGDKVRLTDYGIVEFLGRLDRQVKLRGFRIELGDIESALRKLPGISEACVILRQDDFSKEKILAAYVVASEDTNNVDDIRIKLQRELPAYMIPQSIMCIPDIPISKAGKLDEKRLPLPINTGNIIEKEHPLSDQEKSIAQIWKKLLNREFIGRHDNFFDLGGHSLLLIRLHSHLTEELNVDLDVVDLFRYTTVATQAQALSGKTAVTDQTNSSARVSSGEIAVIGMAGRFPGAENVDVFWENLNEGKESITFFNRGELLSAGFSPEQIDKPDFVAANGILKDVELFDADFFDFTPREASTMDPQHRHFLETAWHTLEHGGYDPYRYSGRIGVFAGNGMNTYLLRNLVPNKILEDADVYQVTMGNDKDFIPTRTSYKFNLRGPSVSVNTACSTSLVAIHMACKSLLAGECEMALAGGVSISIPQVTGYVYQQKGIASPDGHCRAFAENSAGTIGGSGVAAVLLKPLENAIADGDTIHAVIKGSGVNNDGSDKLGFTAPGLEGQRNAILTALASAGVSAESISYVEAHGTGTVLGDQVEIKALNEAFRKHTDKRQYCAIGAVKSNIGHLDTAAGIAGFIKAVGAVKTGKIPQSLHCEKTNPQINFAETPFYVASKSLDWKLGDRPRRAGISSFGIGGTNAHVIIEEPPESQVTSESFGPYLIPLSARSEKALNELAEALARHLERTPNINMADVAYTLGIGRCQFKHRFSIICNTVEEATSLLRKGIGNSSGVDYSSYPELNAIRSAWLNGEDIDWNSLFKEQSRKRIPLPLYPFQGKRYWIDPPKLDKQLSSSKSTSSLGKRKDIVNWFSVPSWKRIPFSISTDKDKKELFVLHSGSPAEKRLMDYLREQEFQLISYEYASSYNDHSSDRITPFAVDGLVDLIGEKIKQDSIPTILHLALLPSLADKPSRQRLEYVKQFGLFASMSLAKALSKFVNNKKVDILFVVSEYVQVNGRNVVVPEKQLLSGPALVIPQEYKNIKCRTIDLKLSPNGHPSVNSLDLLINELRSETEASLIALHNWRWVRTYEALHLDSNARTVGIKRNLKRQGGVYLITGGVGGIGLALAEFIAENVQEAKLILISKSYFPNREQWPNIIKDSANKQRHKIIIEKILQWEKRGIEVLVLSADVADSKGIKKVLTEISSRFGKINGVIHAAGVPGGSLIVATNEDEISRVLSPKVDGLLNLQELLDIKSLDFMVLCSSLTGLLGGMGQVAYTAANAYLDAFALANANRYRGNIFSIAWDTWKDVGMAVRTAKGDFLSDNKRQYYPMTEILSSNDLSPSTFWPLGEHRIENKYILPGTAYLDMAYRAFINGATSSVRFENVSIPSPLEVSEENSKDFVTVQVGISRGEAGSYSFGIHSKNNGEWTEHVKGHGASLTQKLNRIDIKDLKSRCPQEISEESFELKQGIRVNAGRRWQFDISAFEGKDEAIAFMALPQAFHDDLKNHPLHPALLDRATSFMLATIDGAADFLPFHYGEVNIYAPLTSSIVSYTKVLKEGNSNNKMLFDITIANAEGEILLEIKRYALVRVSGVHRFHKLKPKISPALNIVPETAISSLEGVEVFARILGSHGEPVIYTCTTDLSHEFERIKQGNLDIPTVKHSDKSPRPDLSTPFRQPEGEIEMTIARVWSDLLGIEGIGVDDDLFELGANSLLAIQAVARLEDELSIPFSVDRFFETPTIAGLAMTIQPLTQSENKEEWEQGEI